MPKTYTTRGFAVYDEIADMYGGVVTVQESSNVEGGVWLFYKCPNNEFLEQEHNVGRPREEWRTISSPHLSDEQAEQVIAALTEHLRPVGGEEDGQPRRLIWLTFDQSANALEVMERLLLAAAETARESPNIAKHFDRDVAVFTLLAEQLRAQGVGRDV